MTKGLTYIEFLKVRGWGSEYVSIDKLLKHLARKSKSKSSKRLYLRIVYKFCQNSGLEPDQLILLEKAEIENMVQTYADGYNNERYSRATANRILSVLKIYFALNGFKNGNELEVHGYYMPARYRKRPEYVPEKHEVYRMAESACSLRDRAIILSIYSSGLRVSTLLALLYKDVKDELLRGEYNIMIPVYPEMKKVVPDACKGKIPYFAFLCDEAVEALRLYLEERVDKYGRIDDCDPLFASDYNQIPAEQRKKKFMTERQVQYVVKDAARRAGIEDWKHVTPHCLRKSFEKVLRSEQYDGRRLDPKVQEFFMGHILRGSQDNYFDGKKEELRVEYTKLNFGRTVVENKFKKLKTAVARAFADTGIDVEGLMEEYVTMRKVSKLKN